MPAHPQIIAASFAPRLALFYSALFVVIGIQLPFFPLWLEAKGLDARWIGITLAAPMLIRVISVPIVTRFADRWQMLRGVIITATTGAAIGNLGLGFTEGTAAILVVFCLASAAFTPVMPLAEAYALRGLGQLRRAYGPVRLWGSATFIVGSLGAGWIIDSISPRNLIWLIAAAAAVAALASLGLAPLKAEPTTDEHPVKWSRGFLRAPGFLMIAGAAALIQGSHGIYYGFASLDWNSSGLDGAAVGLLWSIGVLAEITLFAFSARLSLALGPAALVLLGGVGAVVRWTAMAVDPPAGALPFLQCLHALSFGATHLGAIGFVARTAPPGFAATAQGYLAVVLGAVMGVSMALSGAMYAAFGGRAYASMAAVAALGSLLAWAGWRLRVGGGVLTP